MATAKPDTPVDPEEGMGRYLAYFSRFRVLLKLKRYLAYASDVGESLRPVTHKAIVTSCYAVSWTYILYDCHSHARPYSAGSNYEYYHKFGKEFLFQSIASMLIPTVVIHSVVKYSGMLFESKQMFAGLGAKRGLVPVALGLGLIPLFPFVIDHPIESLVNKMISDPALPPAKQKIPDKKA